MKRKPPASAGDRSTISRIGAAPGAMSSGRTCRPGPSTRHARKPRIRLTEPQKIYIVRRLAAYDSLAVVVRGLKEEFGITVASTMLQHYDPNRRAGRDLAPRFKAMFWKARKAYHDGIRDIGSNYPLVRTNWRGEMAQETWGAGQHKVANQILDSITREVAGAQGKRTAQGHFGLRGGPRVASVTIVRRHEPPTPGKPARGARKPSD
jgi:hypothetical protein